MKVGFKRLTGVQFDGDRLQMLNPDWTVRAAFEFIVSSCLPLIELLERRGLVRLSNRVEKLYYCLKEKGADQPRIPHFMLGMELMSQLAFPHQMLPVIQDGPIHTYEDAARGTRRQKLCRGNPLSAPMWNAQKRADGSILQPNTVKEEIMHGGISHTIRAEVWMYLLGLKEWQSSTEMNSTRRNDKAKEYYRMKAHWDSFEPAQQNHFNGFKERSREIDRDVKETAKQHDFYRGAKNENVNTMRNILMTYMMHNFNLGYATGMSELLAPILYVVRNESDAYWCFVGFMAIVSDNFDLNQTTMKQERKQLQTLLSFVNGKLYRFLKEKKSENMNFCYRWLFLRFKKDFDYPGIILLWEVLWTKIPCENFHLFVCAAILDGAAVEFIKHKYTSGMINSYVANPPRKLNVKTILKRAEAMYSQVRKTVSETEDGYPQLRTIIGM